MTDRFKLRGTRLAKVFGFLWAVLAMTIMADRLAVSAERGLSSYLPAYYGDFGVAVAPAPGTYGYTTTYNFFADLPLGAADKLKLEASALIAGFQFVAPERLGVVSVGFGAYSAIIDARLEGTVPTGAGSMMIDQHKTGIADTSVSPLIVWWSKGNLHLSFYEAVFLPTGRFNAADSLNLSRNYVSLDSVLAVTWLDLRNGWEFSIVPGILANLENPDTGYKTGTEFHIDAMFNRYLTKTFAVGLHGYVYGQLEEDEIDGVAIAGSQSRAAAIGPSVLWVPSSRHFQGKVVLKWMHDLDASNRFEGDVLSATAAFKF